MFSVQKRVTRSSKLERDDRSRARVVTYHHRSFGIFSAASDPRLEVSPEILPILDEVVMTFVYVENKRRQRRRQSAVAAASA
jgi:hypothetical protein